ncbi:helix-turn-helix domain-containing protein [Desulfovibrio desulfuricans]|uniref:helix-turn-helix domain-containing protein n=1 Tax=Desulfovibrio desulfuricans TaxID=876 RepID=UPI0035B2F895
MDTQIQRWCNTSQAAQHLNCSESLLEKDRVYGLLKIPYSRIGRRIVYDLHDLDRFLEGNKTNCQAGVLG